jgi:hypothetical protein
MRSWSSKAPPSPFFLAWSFTICFTCSRARSHSAALPCAGPRGALLTDRAADQAGGAGGQGPRTTQARHVIGSQWVQTPRHCDPITCLGGGACLLELLVGEGLAEDDELEGLDLVAGQRVAEVLAGALLLACAGVSILNIS